MNLKNWIDRLIWATILVTVVRYAAAFMASDLGEITGFASDTITFFLTLTGLGMGILDTVGGGLLFNGWSKVFPKAGTRWTIKFKILTFCVISLVVSGMIILVPFTVSRLAHESVLLTLGGKDSFWTWLWSGMVNFIPYVLIIGVFAGNKMVTELEQESGTVLTENSPNSPSTGKPNQKNLPNNLPSDWRKARPLLNSENVLLISTWTQADIREVSKDKKIEERTLINWRTYAKREVEMNNATPQP